jgi:alkylation response protein AidB-like acyl-CoA dehydrogenase
VNLDLTETQAMLRGTIRDCLANEVPFERVRELERSRSWDEALWHEVCRQGWVGVTLAEEAGGGGGSLSDVGLVVEEFARRAVIVPIAEVLACAWLLGRFIEPDIAAPMLDGILSATVLPVPACSDDLVFDGVSVRGTAAFVDYGREATHHFVVARDGETERLLIVAADAAGVSVQKLETIGRTPTVHARYELSPAVVAGDAVVAGHLRAAARALTAVQCVGSMQAAFEMTIEYARFREQFGRPIGSFQAVKHHCADMAIRVESARFLAYEALAGIDSGRASESDIALAKAAAARAVPFVTMLAHQIHGGNGVIEENDLYFFTLRAKDRSLAWGGLDECLDRAAADIDEPVEWL